MIVISGKFYAFISQRGCIQRKMLLRKSYFEYFFRADGRQYVQTKAKSPKKANYLKWDNTENLKNHIKIAQLYQFFSNAAQKSCFELYFKFVQETYLFNLLLLKIVKDRRELFKSRSREFNVGD